MKKIKQSISICLILMLLSAFAMTVVADANPITPIDTAKEATLTVQFHTTNNQPIENAVFKLWKVGEVTKAGAFRINAPYLSVYNPEDEWKNVVLQMLQKAEQENIEPLLTATTDSNGVAAFQSTDDVKLRAGLYIVDGALKRGNQYAFKATPFIVRLPNFVGENHDGVNDDEDVWNYDVIAVPKEYTVSLYTVYYNDNRQSIGNREVTRASRTRTAVVCCMPSRRRRAMNLSAGTRTIRQPRASRQWILSRAHGTTMSTPSGSR